MERGKKIIGESITKNWKQTDCAHLGERFHIGVFPFSSQAWQAEGKARGSTNTLGCFLGWVRVPGARGGDVGAGTRPGLAHRQNLPFFSPGRAGVEAEHRPARSAPRPVADPLAWGQSWFFPPKSLNQGKRDQTTDKRGS